MKYIQVGRESKKVHSGRWGIKGSMFSFAGNQGKYIQVEGESRAVQSRLRGITGCVYRLW